MFVESDIDTPRSKVKPKKRKSFIEFNVKDVSPSKPDEGNEQNSVKKAKKEKKRKAKKGKDVEKNISTGHEDQSAVQEVNENNVEESRDKVVKSKAEIKQEFDYVNMLLHKDTLDQLKDNDSDEASEDDAMEEDNDDKNDEKFVEEMSALDGKRKKILVNRGSRQALSEDSAPGKDRIDFKSLLNTLDDSTRQISKRIKKNSKVLDVPLHRVAAEKITRAAGYTRVRQEVNIWDSVVQSNRTQESISFPLETPDLRWKTSTEVIKTRFTADTPLELQVAAMLAGSKAVPKEGEELSEIEKRALEGMTKEEINERRAEIAKFRALRGYQATKYKRQSKIKSKSYRKLMRKIKNKEELKRLENLAVTDPQAAAEHIEKMNKVRILERATLKHRNASKFMQEQARRAKLTKDKDLQAVLRDQLATHRDMLTKPKIVSDEESNDDEEDSEDDIDITKYQDESYADFAAGYKKYWTQNQEAKQEQLKNEKMSALDEIENMFEDVEHSKKLAELRKQKKREMKKEKEKLLQEKKEQEEEESEEDMEENNEEETGIEHAESINIDPLKKAVTSISGGNKTKSTADATKDIDPDNFVAVKAKNIKSSVPAEIVGFNDEEDSSEDEMEQRKLIAEAFAEDDVLEDFKKEKAKIIEEATPKDIDLTLPGWGSWGGESIKISKKKRNRFIIKAPPRAPRKDDNKDLVIINTDKDQKLRTHQVSKLPAHFTSVSDFEASIRSPIGDTFVPRTAHLKLIKPRVTTKMGQTIQPMDKKALLKKNQQLVDEIAQQSEKLFQKDE